MTLASKKLFEQAVYDCIEKANRDYGISIHCSKIIWKKNGRYAGMAYYSKLNGKITEQWLSFSEEALSIYPEEMMRNIIPHEVAHLVCFSLGNDNGHGINWQRVCKHLGGNGRRTHNMSLTKARSTKQYEYCAPSGKLYMISSRIHKCMRYLGMERVYKNGDTLASRHFTGKVVSS